MLDCICALFPDCHSAFLPGWLYGSLLIAQIVLGVLFFTASLQAVIWRFVGGGWWSFAGLPHGLSADHRSDPFHSLDSFL
jgi:hypothetical protein